MLIDKKYWDKGKRRRIGGDRRKRKRMGSSVKRRISRRAEGTIWELNGRKRNKWATRTIEGGE